MRGTFARAAVLVAALCGAGTVDGTAQTVVLAGRLDPELGPRLRALVESGAYVLPADTILPAGDTIRGTVLVAGGTYYVEGHVAGDVIGVDASVFLRPRSSVGGDVVNAGGGLYRSMLSDIRGAVIDRPLSDYTVERTATGFRIVGGAPGPLQIVLPEFAGFRIPTYDRANGLSLRWGPAVQLALSGRDTAELAAWGSYFSERGDFGGGAELRVGRAPLRLRAGGERDWRTNEEWIRAGEINSLIHIWNGKDYRNYYGADRRWAFLESTRVRRRTELTGRAGLQVEDANSLTAGSPWSVLEPDSVRPNLRIDDGRISSAIAGVDLEWVGLRSAIETTLELEHAGEWLDGEHDFSRFRFFGEWGMAALANHVLEFEWMTMGPLPGTDSLPRQRYSFVGGSNTLNTQRLEAFPGDRIVLLETKYIIPLQRYRIRFLGVPEIQLIHAAGKGWTHGGDATLEQEIGIRLQFAFAYARVMINPEEGKPEFNVNFSSPFRRGRPWERPR